MIIKDKATEGHNHLLDFLKGLSIIFIIITHFAWEPEERLRFLFPFWIDMAVPVFMIISGYVNTLSFEKRDIRSVGKAYTPGNIVDKLIRYTVPFSLIYAFEIVYTLSIGYISLSRKDAFISFMDFFSGGPGQGSYYYPIMMQFVFVFPVIFFIVKKYNFHGVIICGLINAAYELLKTSYHMNEECYRLLLFRYILLIAIGCYLATKKGKLNLKLMCMSFALGIMFIVAFSYCGYDPIIIVYWTGTSFIACMYIIPVAMILIKKLSNVRFQPLEICGKASYNIFLIQMVWYRFFSYMLDEYFARPVHLIMNIIICLGLGILYYYLETPLTRRIIKSIKLSS